MSEFPTNPEAFDPREQLALLDLIEAVREKFTHALAYEENLRQLSVQAGQAGARTTNIASHEVEGNERVVGPHHLVIWVPEYGEAPYFGISRLEVRTPDDTDSDFFIRIYDLAENEQNYLLNSKGLKPFNLATTDIEPVSDLEYGTANYVVREGTIYVPAVDIDVTTLDAIFNTDTYKYFEQPRNTDEHPPWGRAS